MKKISLLALLLIGFAHNSMAIENGHQIFQHTGTTIQNNNAVAAKKEISLPQAIGQLNQQETGMFNKYMNEQAEAFFAQRGIVVKKENNLWNSDLKSK